MCESPNPCIYLPSLVVQEEERERGREREWERGRERSSSVALLKGSSLVSLLKVFSLFFWGVFPDPM